MRVLPNIVIPVITAAYLAGCASGRPVGDVAGLPPEIEQAFIKRVGPLGAAAATRLAPGLAVTVRHGWQAGVGFTETGAVASDRYDLAFYRTGGGTAASLRWCAAETGGRVYLRGSGTVAMLLPGFDRAARGTVVQTALALDPPYQHRSLIVVRTDAGAGFSGGPVATADGCLIGIAAMRVDHVDRSFAKLADSPVRAGDVLVYPADLIFAEARRLGVLPGPKRVARGAPGSGQ